MHRDRSFSAGDVVRIFEEHLEPDERRAVVEYFILNFCVVEGSLQEDLTQAAADAIIELLIDFFTPDFLELAFRQFIEISRKGAKRLSLRKSRRKNRQLLGLAPKARQERLGRR